jgi:hypothetical protein
MGTDCARTTGTENINKTANEILSSNIVVFPRRHILALIKQLQYRTEIQQSNNLTTQISPANIPEFSAFSIHGVGVSRGYVQEQLGIKADYFHGFGP